MMICKTWCYRISVFAVCWLLPGIVWAQSSNQAQLDPGQFGTVLAEALKRGTIVGAQLSVGGSKGSVLSTTFGKLSPAVNRAANAKTLFCIGSSSKPVASAIILKLVESRDLELDRPVSQWIAEFERIPLENGGTAPRAPTVRELLAHRGGIYSQKQRQTAARIRAIRDFTQTLEQSVDLIVRQPLIVPAGSQHAYSGAGYCLLGRVAELATNKPFEQLLQEHVCQPLELERTTYFPRPADRNVAVPGVSRGGDTVVQPKAPHLLRGDLRFTLIGGSVYSTADEFGEFARMILNKGRHRKRRVLSQGAWDEVSRQQYPKQSYGLGWTLTIRNRRIAQMMHTGSLTGYRSMILVDLERGFYVVALWTLADSSSTDMIVAQLRRAAGRSSGRSRP